ncbi:MAG: M43 family zinc metalloprotease [Bacteroidota bacterium]
MRGPIRLILFLCTAIVLGTASEMALFAQGRTCATVDKELLYRDAAQRAHEQRTERRIRAWIDAHADRRGSTVTYTIPTVVHVVQFSQINALTDQCIFDQLEVLNRDFQKRNADTTLVPNEFLAVLGDAEIEFCLARLDPDGNPTTGITRTISPMWANHNPGDEDSLKAQVHWPPDRYYNIWVPSFINGGILGYATFPSQLAASPQLDGVVINGQHFGSGDCANPPYDQGRTLTHETGHWLGLFHTFQGGPCQGNSAATCAISGDNICDTPPVSGSTFGCPGNKNTCLETPLDRSDMTMNYMDYVNDACMYMFSAGQVDRVQAILGTVRASIVTDSNRAAAGCECDAQSPCRPTASFEADRRVICPGTSINFSDASVGPATNWTWTFNGGNPSTSTQPNPTVTYPNPGNYTVSLVAANAQGSGTRTVAGYITVRPRATSPLFEGFEGGFPSDWRTENVDNAVTWEATGLAAASGFRSVYVDNWDYDAAGTPDDLVTPPFDFTNNLNGDLSFDWAYRESVLGTDTLQVWCSPDCGENWTKVWERGGADLATAAGTSTVTPFLPNSGDWATDTLGLSAYLGSNGFQARFRNVGGGGNTLWLDNINLSGIVGADGPSAAEEIGLAVRPVPFRGSLLVEYTLPQASSVEIALLDLAGRTHFRANAGRKAPGSHRFAVPEVALGSLAAGMYFLRIQSERGEAVRKVVKGQ